LNTRMTWSRSAGRLGLAAVLIVTCMPPSESVRTTASMTETAGPGGSDVTASGSARVGAPTDTRRSAIVGDRSVTLEPYIWVDFQPGGPARGVFFSATLRAAGGSVPAGLGALRFRLITESEVWTDSPAELRSWTSPQTGIVTLEVVASDGPRWPPGTTLRAIVRISYWARRSTWKPILSKSQPSLDVAGRRRAVQVTDGA
jgi:hypothetical protein